MPSSKKKSPKRKTLNLLDLTYLIYFSHVEGDIYHIHQGDEYLVRKESNSSNVFMSSDSKYTREWTISVTEDYYNLSCTVESNTRRFSFYSLSSSYKYFCASSSSSSSYHYSIRLLSLEDSCHDFVEAMKSIQCNDYINGPSVSEWNNAKEEYLKISEQPILNFLRVTPGEESNLYSIEWALAKYDYIISKYGNSKYDDFISERNNKSKSSSFLFSTIGNNYIVPSFVIGLTVLSITTYFFLRKREED